jgi:hypothetical protein
MQITGMTFGTLLRRETRSKNYWRLDPFNDKAYPCFPSSDVISINAGIKKEFVMHPSHDSGIAKLVWKPSEIINRQ